MEYNYPKFTPEMKKTHTILIPNMAITQFRLLEYALRYDGYKCEILGNCGSAVAQLGLKYVHNDTCYPALLVIGQFLDALNSGKYDLDHTALLITQTGGGCRASNYIGFIRRALKKAGMEHIPVISLNLSGLEDNPGFKLSPALVLRGIYAAVFGDIFMKCVYRMRPYEAVPGTTNKIHRKWAEVVKKFVSEGYPSRKRFKKLCKEIINDFDNIETLDIQSPGFEASKVKQVVSDWITKYGDKLNAIVLADDSDQAIGAAEACEAAGRDDIVIVAAGISKQGLDLVKDGKLYGMSYQTCQGDAGLAVRTISEWFCGIDVNRVNYLRTDVVTSENTADFEPCQW